MNSKKQRIAILGATGSIGSSTLDVIRSNPKKFDVFAVSGFSNIKKLHQIAQEFSPSCIVLPNESSREKFLSLPSLNYPYEILLGEEGLCSVSTATETDVVVCAIVGAAGLKSAYEAARKSKKILLANKEVLVTAGALFMSAISKYGAQLIPVDSEHNAIFQCLPPSKNSTYIRDIKDLKRVHITASGGPFLKRPLDTFESITLEEASKHPNWSMGRKITIDSSTMVNKGLEIIEAKYLFNLNPEQINVLVHPQSIVHSFVEYIDGSLLAQLGHHDMRIPISYALGYPDRINHTGAQFDIKNLFGLEFSEPDYKRFPCLKLAFEALMDGNVACQIFNTSNEIAVESFIAGKIKYIDIPKIIAKQLETISQTELLEINDIIEFDFRIRELTKSYITKC
ncbi:1-deoxy-D-xylulose-5-phosphate reductoisomerase [Taylorella equigenitalis]|uniref:1-deoxy-D-xylulose 5-phosphate reductoisomerase n=1 Tax=Taylorella equigenitalis (strain MCE9) TaxID=937774 RepID=A0A654KIU0_TAYEM|nr:1-deoxy-D-xylulose-5-phosphate reductoisomerase [Taylorella equigenitalis]ADU92320.1 1-deoxy-D-xylulose 5-phosphate reductoisomerase [Taylorella equigenitalis MCE9]ASY40806.1 1-deoxy-D-xylulose-5-phosphate reductoisomerase [Taylorella equigenitalis]WDU54151.1 1-deoxy-D-xylulose-5-phosphate reductoisomerase [Taylorella equigenitalis]WDU57064.1 1-deoxy-D-xylulose-5-phosphate reductoisomerase [Taylorella equigenitalis]